MIVTLGIYAEKDADPASSLGAVPRADPATSSPLRCTPTSDAFSGPASFVRL